MPIIIIIIIIINYGAAKIDIACATTFVSAVRMSTIHGRRFVEEVSVERVVVESALRTGELLRQQWLIPARKNRKDNHNNTRTIAYRLVLHMYTRIIIILLMLYPSSPPTFPQWIGIAQLVEHHTGDVSACVGSIPL